MAESTMRQYVVNTCLRPWDGVSVENRVGPGHPDVNWACHEGEGNVELKQVKTRPAKGGPIRIPHFTAEQRAWLRKRANAGGRVHVLLQLEQTWLLFKGAWAAEYLGGEPEEELKANAIAVWEGRPPAGEFREALING